MEHHLLQPQQLIMASSGFINLSNGSGGCGFAFAPVGFHSCEWAGDPVQLAGQTTVWQCEGGPWDDNPPPPVCVSMDGGGGDGRPPPPPWAEQQGVPEPELAAGNVLGARKRKDRAKTIVLERNRRVRMTETLYQLRSLVPNITKMDKASIIGDAVEYVKSLQSHARKLKEEVALLEARRRSSSPGPQRDHRAGAPAADEHQDAGSGARGVARVVGATRVGEGRFLVTAECERRDGAAARLCAAVESLASCFRVESSSLGRAAPDRLVSTVTLKATCQVEAATIGEGTVKLLMMAALSEEGFRIDGGDGGRHLLTHHHSATPSIC